MISIDLEELPGCLYIATNMTAPIASELSLNLSSDLPAISSVVFSLRQRPTTK